MDDERHLEEYIAANHMDMTKYRSQHDPEYLKVSASITQMVKSALSRSKFHGPVQTF